MGGAIVHYEVPELRETIDEGRGKPTRSMNQIFVTTQIRLLNLAPRLGRIPLEAPVLRHWLTVLPTNIYGVLLSAFGN